MSARSSSGTGGRRLRCPAPARPAAPLRAAGARKRFGATIALAGVDVVVDPGSVVGIVGPNGSGKTTLLRAAAGLAELDAGSILVAGAPAGSRSARAATALVPDEPSGFDELTVSEFIALVHALWAAAGEARDRARVLTTAFGLDGRRDIRLGALSRGLRRRASVVAALSLAPSLLLVDEATATLDPDAVVVLHEALRELAARGAGVLLATQDLHFAGEVCDEIVLLHSGAVIDQGAPPVLRARHEASSMEGVFLTAVGDARLRERVRDALGAL